MLNYNQNSYRLPNNPYRSGVDFKKQYEKAKLKKVSNGLGFFVSAYFLSMLVCSVVIMLAIIILSGALFSTDALNSFYSDITGGNSLTHYYSIFVSVFSAFVPALFYLLFSRNKMSDCISVKRVKPSVFFPIIFMGFAAAMIANTAAYMVESNFSYFELENSLDFSESSSSLYMNFLYVISTAIVPAFAEEFAFRGVLMGTLRKYGDSFAIIASSVMFAAMHGNITQIPFTFILGLIFAYADCKTNSLIPSICIHFLNNFYAVILDILGSESILSDFAYYITYYGITVLIIILGIIGFIIINKRDSGFFRLKEHSELSLSLKEKNVCFFTSAGVVISLSFFVMETIYCLI